MNETRSKYFDPNIPGLYSLLKQTDTKIPPNEKGFLYYPVNGLTIVIYGIAGLGKTNLALQMAFEAAKSGKQVIYLTKDTKSEVLLNRINQIFKRFGNLPKETTNPELKSKPDCQPDGVNFISLGKLESDDFLKYPESLKSMMAEPFFAIADFDEAPSNTGKVDRFGIIHSVYDALGCLVPRLRPLFDRMEDLEQQQSKMIGVFKEKELVIVCDSLSAPALEESMRQRNAKYADQESYIIRKPICLFVMEVR